MPPLRRRYAKDAAIRRFLRIRLSHVDPFGCGKRHEGFDPSPLALPASVESAGKYLAEAERKFRKRCAENKSTQVRNIILRAFAEAKFSVLLSLKQSVSIVSAVKWGLDSGILQGIDDGVLCSLLYRVQDGHLEFLLKNGGFAFEADIQNDTRLKIERLRALIVQEAFEAVQFNL